MVGLTMTLMVSFSGVTEALHRGWGSRAALLYFIFLWNLCCASKTSNLLCFIAKTELESLTLCFHGL